MKVLVFTSLYPNNMWPHHGVFVKERMTSFARIEGCQIKVIAPVPYFPPIKLGSRWAYSQVVKKEVIEGVEVYHPRYFMMPKLGMGLYGFMMFLSTVRLVQRVRREFDFDVIDTHYVYPDGFAAIFLGRFCKKPVVVSARGSDINLYKTFPLIRKILRVTLRWADGVIAVSQALKEAMFGLQIPEKKISVIPNGVDHSKFYKIPRTEARTKLGLPDKRIILSVGGLTPVKGFDLLIRACRVVVEEFGGNDLYLVIAGEGSSRKSLEQLIHALRLEDHVRLVGSVPHDELYLWYNAADLFCLASCREGWPNVVLESLACGTPVVATAVGGIPEIIRSDVVGLLAERTEMAIARAIVQALKTPWQSDAIVRYAQEYSWERVARSVEQVFESVLEERGVRSRNKGAQPTVVSHTG